MGNSHRNEIRKGRYMPGLDGLRALSVLAVIAYHMNASWATGGFLGVGVFFTLSGYLITDQLAAQWQSSGRINLREFWMRRIRRLVPAMLFLLVVLLVWLFLFDRQWLVSLQGDFFAVALYFHNWWLIFHDVSYFASFGPPSPIGHLWSLAIEEQFYLVWPIILAMGLFFIRRRGKLVIFILLGAAISAFAMAMIYIPGTDPSRVYYGSDTRAFALLIGAALAMVWPSRRLSVVTSLKSRLMLDAIGGSGLLLILIMIWTTNEYDHVLYGGGLTLFAIVTAVVTAVLAHPSSYMARIMGNKLFRWIGTRSYSLYLWHYPVIILSNPTIGAEGQRAWIVAIQLLISLAMAEISWRFVEEPIRRGTWLAMWKELRSRISLKPQFIVVIPIMFFIVLLYSSGWSVEKTSANTMDPGGISTIDSTVIPNDDPPVHIPVAEGNSDTSPPLDIPDISAPIAESEPDSSTEEANNPEGNADDSEAEDAAPDKRITIIGDSVILDAAPYLEKSVKGIIIDGKVGRQMSQAQEVIDRLKDEGKLGDQVVIELGTNGTFSNTKLRELLDSIDEDVQQVIFINIRVPRKWQHTVNTNLEKIAEEYSKVTVIDWYSASEGKDSFFYDDGVHLRQEGAKFYASLICEAL